MTALNDRLRFITASGQIDHAAIEADIPRRADEIKRRYNETRRAFGLAEISDAEWLLIARQDLNAFADGESALYEVRASRAAAPVLMAAE